MMKLVVIPTDYGTERYFVFYIMDKGKCLTARWSKKFERTDTLDNTTVVEL